MFCLSLSDLSYMHMEETMEMGHDNGFMESLNEKINLPAASKVFFTILYRKTNDVSSRLMKWGYPIPSALIEKVNEHLPKDFVELHSLFKNEGVCLKCAIVALGYTRI